MPRMIVVGWPIVPPPKPPQSFSLDMAIALAMGDDELADRIEGEAAFALLLADVERGDL